MRILLTNDDGIHAEGLAVLERIARHLSDDIWIVAPETDQSGLAHSLTLSHPLRLREVSEKRYAVTGTPTDCVIMGVRKLMKEPPALILSGVNAGQNLADDVTYSGTVAGAIEGTLLGIRSIALSQAYDPQHGRVLPWNTAESMAPDLLKKLADVDLPAGTLLNINFPRCEVADVEGTEVTTQGKLTHGLQVEQREDGRGFPYYWLRFSRRQHEFHDGTDLNAVNEKKISVTPLKLDLTDHDLVDRVRESIG
ncbi:5'/3'-nucleotidase SurE [Hoeflea sp. WL0058]|uniref:5'-nucleotidase SurE n=1 Tax=Flavimaribacter sediminis TaxID=2865987 RepID=A0AAE2ZLN1_9HYPH|nr:5'/3'-nucleotidase SurE [Flavimaribacter sediminis]MBW8637141.1 5'/3'-nucleotidase SurE [Flavimaribacter sediminis]